MSTVIKVENLSKYYRLGLIGGGTLRGDLERWWAKMRGKPDPLLQIGQAEIQDDEYIWALRDISFSVQQGEILGIIGKNGAGKSTLLKILSRITAPTSGIIKIKGRTGSLLEVGTGFHPELTGRENVYLNGAILGMTKSEVDKKFDEIVDFSGVEKFIDTPVKRYSSGMTVRLGFAVAAHLDPEILIVDEVLAVGDAAFQEKCLGKMDEVAQGGRTVLFVSHQLGMITKLCHRTLWIDEGRIYKVGDSTDIVSQYLADAVAPDDASKPLPEGFLYHEPDIPLKQDCAVTGIQILDREHKPMQMLRTWDYVRFRIYYRSETFVEHGSVVFRVQTNDGTVLTLASTQPDSTTPYSIQVGEHFVDCVFSRWPYAEGKYILGVGLAVPGQYYICKNDTLCNLEVIEQDVYGSGLPPASNRYLVATVHEWDVFVDETIDY